MAKKKKGVFEADRRMELRMRLAVKRARDGDRAGLPTYLNVELPERDLLGRIIARVRTL